MASSLTSFLKLTVAFLFFCNLCVAKRKWEYEPISISVTTNDDSKIQFETKVDRIKRGEFALSGKMNVKYDIDDSTTVEFIALRSSSGAEDDYKLLPWTLPNETFSSFVNGAYKDIVLPNLDECTNLPRYEGDFEPPFPQMEYTFDKCVAKGEGLPEIAPEGFYKVIGSFMGEVEWQLTIIVKITTALM